MDTQFQGLRTECSCRHVRILCQSCTGDALTCIRAVDDMHGLTASQRLREKYKRKTLARAIRVVGTVTHTPKVNELSTWRWCWTSGTSSSMS